MRLTTILLVLGSVLPVMAPAADLSWEPVPIYDQTARDVVETVLAKYEVGVTYTATRTGILRMNGRALCPYVRIWEQQVLAIADGVYSVQDRFRDNVNAECALREVRSHVDDYTKAGWVEFLTDAKASFGETAISVYVDKDEDVFGWSLNSDAIRYGEVTGWAEFLDRFLLMMRRGGRAEVAGDVFEFTVENATYSVTR